MLQQRTEFCVATVYDDTDVETPREWERFRSRGDAERYASLLVHFGLGAVLFSAMVVGGVPRVEQAVEIARFEQPAR
jgi:hypothetical protein